MAFFTFQTGWLATGLVTAGLAGYTGLVNQLRRTATLTRLTALDSCLTVNNRLTAQAAAGTLASIETSVEHNRRQAEDLWVQQQAQRIRAATQTLADTLHHLQQYWPARGTPAALARLRRQLNQYTDTLGRFGPEVAPLTRFAPHRAGWFGEVDLRTLPTPAARAALTRLEAQVRQVEADALAQQAAKIGSPCNLGGDRIYAFAAPASNTVAPGAPYEARLMLSITATGLKQQLRADGRPVPIDPRTNQGLVTFWVPPARPGQPDTVRRQWLGEVQVNIKGQDSVQRVVVPYFIVKPPQP